MKKLSLGGGAIHWLAVVLVLLGLSAVPVAAGELAGVEMEDTITAGEQELVLNGMALRSKAFIKVYVAGLYLPKKMNSGQAILSSDAPRRVVLEFVRNVGRDSMCGAFYDGLRENVPNSDDALKKQFDEFCTWLPDAEAGDRFVFTYHPDHGTHVGIAGQSKGTLKGKPFADALFSSWIGPEPGPGQRFKDALLGG